MHFAVRRYLIIFFIVFLPFQFAWGAAARYCEHEKGDKISHFGHHSHVHKTAANVDAGQASPLAGSDDPNCDYCHIGCAQPLPSSFQNFSAVSQAIHVSP